MRVKAETNITPKEGRGAYEKMLNTVDHQGNARQNHLTPVRMARAKTDDNKC